MGVGLLIGVIIGIFLLVLSLVSYFYFSKRGLRKTAIGVSSILALMVVIPVMAIIFESELYLKSDVQEDLRENGVVFDEDFDIINNEISGFPGFFQHLELKLSNEDVLKIILQIKSSKDYKVLTGMEKGLLEKMKSIRGNSPRIEWNYNKGDAYIRESYQKQEGYVPIFDKIILRENSDILSFYREM